MITANDLVSVYLLQKAHNQVIHRTTSVATITSMATKFVLNSEALKRLNAYGPCYRVILRSAIPNPMSNPNNYPLYAPDKAITFIPSPLSKVSVLKRSGRELPIARIVNPR